MLSDRAVVLTGRPGRVDTDETIPLARPRRPEQEDGRVLCPRDGPPPPPPHRRPAMSDALFDRSGQRMRAWRAKS